MKKIFLIIPVFLLIFAFVFGVAIIDVQADEVDVEEIGEVVLDENIEAEDLDVEEPTLLPGSPFYFVKNWGRGIRSVLAFDPIKKAELKIRFADEKIIEVKKLVETGEDQNTLDNALEGYDIEIEKIKEELDALGERGIDQEELDKILNKFTDSQIKHQKLFDRLETKLPEEKVARLIEVKEKTMERFARTAVKLEDPEKFGERIDEIMEEQEGSKFKHFKNLEVLIRLEEKVPEQAKASIHKATENSLKRLRGDLEKMSPEDQERFADYLDGISGNEAGHLEIIGELKKGELPEKAKESILRAEEAKTERLQKKTENMEELDFSECLVASDCGVIQECGTTWECVSGECKQLSKECPRVKPETGR